MAARRTPDGKRIKTLYISGAAVLAHGEVSDVNAAGSHTFQDDVRVIGAEVTAEALLTDVAINADGQFQHIATVSKHGDRANPGDMVAIENQGIWHGIFYAGTPTRRSIVVMFPEGYGVDYDDGETINLHHYCVNETNTTVNFYENAIIYYVER